MTRFFSTIRQSWRSLSLRTQLVVMMSALLLATIVVTTALAATLFRSELITRMDEDLHANRNNVSVYLTSMGSDTSVYYNPQSILRFYGVLLTNDGELTSATTQVSSEQDAPQIPAWDEHEVAQHANRSFTVAGTKEHSAGWRVRMYRLESGTGSVAIALPMNQITTPVERATTLVATVGLMATVTASMIAYMLATRAFQPLLRVEKTAAKIAAGDLSQRVDLGPPDTEVGRLSRSLNAMLSHVEGAFRAKEESENRMRQFVQDASHELRTPLVTIRGFSELYGKGGITSAEDTSVAMARINSEATRMSQLVEDLLTLARLDEQRRLDIQPLDLLVLANDAVLDAKVSAPTRRVTLIGLDGGIPRSATVQGDEGKLRQVIANLMSNALRYTPEGTDLEIAVGVEPVIEGHQNAVVEIIDHGEGISDEDANRIFQRFYRADSSRQSETGGTGLGLAIVAGIVAQHDGSVTVRPTEGGGATMAVKIPHAPDADLEHDALELPQFSATDETRAQVEVEPEQPPAATKKARTGPLGLFRGGKKNPKRPNGKNSA
ncbi:sensor histidine kinase [Micrococcoides hystricis]|uniref:histidine kinase n=1 Tax=Micrococcoides hystricis TaxID=1572761 RepID=A0ABV6PBW0_9MICC